MDINTLLYIIGGGLIGYLFGIASQIAVRHKKTRRKESEAPTPVDIGFDVNNPINGRLGDCRGMVVEICGKQFVRMN